MTLSQSDRDRIDKFCKNVNLVLTLDHGGRAGSNFFQCLFDAHEELVASPLVHYMYSYWQGTFGDRNEISLEEAHNFIAHTSYSRLLYHDPEGHNKDLICKIGGDETAPFDREFFRSLIDELFKGSGNITRRKVITRLYAAYAMCRGFDLSKAKYIEINDAVSQRSEDLRAGFSASILDQALLDFPDVVFLALLRDPRAQYASTRHQMVNAFGNNYDIHLGSWWKSAAKLWNNNISLDHGPAHFCLMYQVAAFRALIEKWREGKGTWLFLRNEDFNMSFVPTMTALCKDLGIHPDPEWIEKGDDYKAKMMGRPWAGTGAYSSRYQKVTDGPLSNDKQEDVAKTVGPNKYVTQRWKTRIPRHEQAILEKLFYYEIKYFDYPFLIPDKEKSSWRYIYKQLLPWSGELPGLKWLRIAPDKKTFFSRIFYLMTLWPLYILARYKILLYDKRDIFFAKSFDLSKDIKKIQFVGDHGPHKLHDDKIPPIRILSDKINMRLLFEALKSRFASGNSVCVTLIDPGGSKFIHKAVSFIANIETCSKDLGDFTNDDGKHLFCDRESLLLKTHEKIAAKFNLQKFDILPPAAKNIEEFEAFISRYVVTHYAHRYASSLLTCSLLLSEDVKADLVLLERHPASEEWINKIKEPPKVVFYSEPGLLFSDLKNIVRLILLRLSFLMKKEAPYKDIPDKEKKLAVQYVSGIENRGYGTDFDWLPYSDLEFKDLIYLMENEEKHSDRSFKAFGDKEPKIVRLSDLPRDRISQESKMEMSQAVRFCLQAFFHTRGGWRDKIRAASISTFYSCVTIRWLHFYRNLGVLGYLNVADTNIDALPKMHALEYLGGVDLSYQFSGTGYHSFMDSKPTGRHQYIAWGPMTERMMENCDRLVPYRLAPQKIFYAGNMKFYLKDQPLSDQREILKKIKLHSGKHKILVMDSAPTHLKFMSRKKIENFYDAVFYVINKRPDDLFIIKPQRDLILREDQKEKIIKLQQEGRLILTPAFGLFHYLLPVADIVIGMPIYASCLMESCAAQKPVICFDQMNWPHMMLKEFPKRRLAGNDKELLKAVDYGLSNVDDLDKLYKIVDPYADQKGHERFGFYLWLWVRHLRESNSANDALGKVEKAYYKKWPLPNNTKTPKFIPNKCA